MLPANLTRRARLARRPGRHHAESVTVTVTVRVSDGHCRHGHLDESPTHRDRR
jgi:hypothetical protein